MSDQKKLAIIATKGTLDFAYPPLILATTAAALDYEVTIFWTFYGLQVLKKNRNLGVSPLGNPGMPMIPPGMSTEVPMPNLAFMIPGMEKIATMMMEKKMASKGVASLDNLLEMAIEFDVNMIACQMTVDLFDMKHSELLDGVEYAGAAKFFEVAEDANITLFI